MRVLDAKTDEPLRGISVYQVVTSDVYGGCIKIFPSLKPTDHHYTFEMQKSNDNGGVTFDQKQLKLACSEYIAKEYLIVNVDLRPGIYEGGLAKLPITRAGALVHFALSPLKDEQEKYAVVLNDNYRGYVIYSTEFPMGSDFWQGKQKLYDVVTNGRGLLAPSQKFIVRLDHLDKN